MNQEISECFMFVLVLVVMAVFAQMHIYSIGPDSIYDETTVPERKVPTQPMKSAFIDITKLCINSLFKLGKAKD